MYQMSDYIYLTLDIYVTLYYISEIYISDVGYVVMQRAKACKQREGVLLTLRNYIYGGF